MKTKYFKEGGDNHRIDAKGNHFVNGKCVNPKSYEGSIGDTHPTGEVQPAIEVTGFVPHTITKDSKGRDVFNVTR